MKLRNKNTGEIKRYDICLDLGSSEGFGRVEYCYDTIEELNDEWEDYIPPEPLIKDEKIRKAVRAWAEANEITNIHCYQYKRTCEFYCERTDLDCYASIMLIGDDIIDKRHNNATYTITELCGEENQ